MSIYNDICDFFGITVLSAESTFIDLVNYGLSLMVAIFIVAFMIRSIFMVCTIPSRFKL